MKVIFFEYSKVDFFDNFVNERKRERTINYQ